MKVGSFKQINRYTWINITILVLSLWVVFASIAGMMKIYTESYPFITAANGKLIPWIPQLAMP